MPDWLFYLAIWVPNLVLLGIIGAPVLKGSEMVKTLREIIIGDRLPFGREVSDKITENISEENGNGENVIKERVTVVFWDGSEFRGSPETTLTVFPLCPHEPL